MREDSHNKIVLSRKLVIIYKCVQLLKRDRVDTEGTSLARSVCGAWAFGTDLLEQFLKLFHWEPFLLEHRTDEEAGSDQEENGCKRIHACSHYWNSNNPWYRQQHIRDVEEGDEEDWHKRFHDDLAGVTRCVEVEGGRFHRGWHILVNIFNCPNLFTLGSIHRSSRIVETTHAHRWHLLSIGDATVEQ